MKNVHFAKTHALHVQDLLITVSLVQAQIWQNMCSTVFVTLNAPPQQLPLKTAHNAFPAKQAAKNVPTMTFLIAWNVHRVFSCILEVVFQNVLTNMSLTKRKLRVFFGL